MFVYSSESTGVSGTEMGRRPLPGRGTDYGWKRGEQSLGYPAGDSPASGRSSRDMAADIEYLHGPILCPRFGDGRK